MAPCSPHVTDVVPAANREPRRGGRVPDLLLLHYTGMRSAAAAVDWLTRAESQVSCHYAIDEHGVITQMVPEAERAWHAGVSHWAGETDINSCSIGIEIHNPGHQIDYRDFPPLQMDAVEALCADIVRRHAIVPARVLGHSDVAPQRKDDPGEKFDWARLARAGVGLWIAPVPVGTDRGLDIGADGEAVTLLRDALRAIGYDVVATRAYDEELRRVVQAFQRHWRQARCDGRADRSTLAAIERVLAAMRMLPSG